jgi:DNA-binding SARP family transcriptional activator
MVKISRPRPKDIYLRRRLFKQLDRMRRFPVTWVSAPAGSGKTTLISSYIEHRKIPCLWYQLDQGDADLATFFYYLGQAAKKAAPRKRKPLPLLTPEYSLGIPTFTLRYFEELCSRFKAPFLFVFDNYQEVPPESALHEVMANALSHIPEGMNVLVMSRNDPPAALVRLKANGYLCLLAWQEVRLAEEEARAIMVQRAGDLCSQEMLGHFYSLSDGWAAGLVLLAETIKRKKTAFCFREKQTFEEIFAYFSEEIFARLDQKTQVFLLTTALLPKMSVAMAEELTADSGSGDLLHAMNRNNYFTSEHIFSQETFYEYHPLYRDFLLSQAQKTFPDQTMNELRRRAALILEKGNQTESAIALLKEIADWAGMMALVLSHAADMIKQGRHRPLQEWLDSLPAEIMQSNPHLLFWKGMSLLYFTPLTAKPFFEQAFDRFQTANDTLGAILAGSGVMHAITLGYDDFKPLDHWYIVLNDLAAKIETFPNPEIEALLVVAMVMALTYREIVHPDAETWKQRAINLAETPDTIHLKIQAVNYLYWHQLLTRGKSALSLLQLLQRLTESHDAQPIALIILQISKVHYFVFLGSNSELIQEVERSLELSIKTGLHLNDMWFYAHAATSFLDCLDHRGAQLWFEKIAPMLEIWPNWLRNLYYLQLMRAALIQGDLPQALKHSEQALIFAVKAGNKYGLACTQLVLAQVFHKMGKEEESLRCLDQARSYALQADNYSHLTIVLLFEAQFSFDKGDEPKGLSLLGQALALARESGYLFTFLDDPMVTLAMCAKALEAGIEVEYAQEIIRKRGLFFDKPPVHIENWPWQVKIYTLGRFGIIQEKKVAQSSRKAQQRPLLLLKALIALGGREIEEEWITNLLWPEADGDMAHQSFESTLHRLRKLLGSPEILQFSAGRLTLDNRLCWVDAWAFEHLLGQAEHLHAQAEKIRAKEVMHKAVNLYRGAFLSGERVEPWMISPSERLRNKYFKATAWLGRMLEAEDRFLEAVKHYEQMLELDDCREETFQRLMTCHARLGQISEALAVYQRCSKTLSSVLGIVPSAETEAIRASLLHLSHKKS